MRKILLTILVALPTYAGVCSNTSVGNGWTCVQSTNCGPTTGLSLTCQFPSNSTANSLFIVAVRQSIAAAPTLACSDDHNTGYANFTASTEMDPANSEATGACWVLNTSSGVKPTVTANLGVSGSIRMAIFEFTGNATSNIFDVGNEGSADTNAPDSGALAMSATNELIFAANGNSTGGATPSAGTNFILLEAMNTSKLITEAQGVATKQTIHGTFSLGASDNGSTVGGAFHSPAAGGVVRHRGWVIQ